jgi:hypothetical protein
MLNSQGFGIPQPYFFYMNFIGLLVNMEVRMAE